MLQILAQHAGKVVTRQQIMKQVWGGSHLDDTHYLRIVVRNLRKKIEVDPTRPRILLTELGSRLSAGAIAQASDRRPAGASPDLQKIYAPFTVKILAALRLRCLAFPPAQLNPSHWRTNGFAERLGGRACSAGRAVGDVADDVPAVSCAKLSGRKVQAATRAIAIGRAHRPAGR